MEKPRIPWMEIAITLAGIALLVGLAFAIDPLHEAVKAALQGDNDEVRHQIDRLGAAGPFLILALTLLHAVVFYPAEIVDAAAGYAYGFFPAMALMTVGWVLSGLICWAVGHRVARPLFDRWFGSARFERVERAIERGGPSLLIAMRLIPILPFSIVSYAAGAVRVPAWRFVWTTAVGYLPITAISVYFGTRLEGLSLTDPLVLGSLLALLALLAIGHRAARRGSANAARSGSEKLPASDQ
ncbi:MAG TPA: VTT domain-containing protein [Solirubrobacterales bacterium]|nr:VTT domain-containing protein [Solirubrobacterales bacterium]